jgi:SAM-dependent methyltransferase
VNAPLCVSALSFALQSCVLQLAAILPTPSISSPETHQLKAHPSISLETLLLSRLRYLARRAQERLLTIKQKFLDQGAQRAAHSIAHLRGIFDLRRPDAQFDKTLGVDTKGPIALSNLHIQSENIPHAIRYEPVNPALFRQALRSIPENFADFTFIDLGCGKGRALLLANEFNFAQIVGVEFAPQLAAIARNNCNRTGVKATIHSQDAIEFAFPPGNLLVYLYNPFGPAVLNPVLNHLLQSQREKFYIVYINPLHRWLSLDARPELQILATAPLYAIWSASPQCAIIENNFGTQSSASRAIPS